MTLEGMTSAILCNKKCTCKAKRSDEVTTYDSKNFDDSFLVVRDLEELEKHVLDLWQPVYNGLEFPGHLRPLFWTHQDHRPGRIHLRYPLCQLPQSCHFPRTVLPCFVRPGRTRLLRLRRTARHVLGATDTR